MVVESLEQVGQLLVPKAVQVKQPVEQASHTLVPELPQKPSRQTARQVVPDLYRVTPAFDRPQV